MILLYDTELHRKTTGLNQTGDEIVRNEINFLNITQRRISSRYNRCKATSTRREVSVTLKVCSWYLFFVTKHPWALEMELTVFV